MLYRYGEFDLTSFLKDIPTIKRRRGNPASTRARFQYKDIVCAFDIETSLVKTGCHNAGTPRAPHIVDDYVSVMYIWQAQFGLDVTIYGREWLEFLRMMDDVRRALGSSERVCFFVHNLAYEFQFLRDRELLGPVLNEESVFCVKPRTPVKFLCYDDKIEFRCSYIHSNMSLDEFTDKMKVEHGKLSGDEFDYTKERFSWTPLTDREMQYCVNDVQGLVECIYKEFEVDHDNLYTLPLTSTGYPRRDVKAAIRRLHPDAIKKLLPDYPTYRLLRAAFRGGNTHASRFYSDKRIDAPIVCMDFSSSYPNVMLNRKYPITPFHEIEPEFRTIDHIIGLISRGRAVLCSIALWDVHLRDQYWPVPYLSRDKCQNIVNADYDNGRIIRADYLETTVTDIDLQIIIDEYETNDGSGTAGVEIIDATFASYGYLPEPIKDVLRKYYNDKTALKGVKDQEIFYNKQKNKLNGIAGMAEQNPVKLEDVYRNGEYVSGVRFTDEYKTRQFMSLEYADQNDIDIYEVAHRYNIDKSIMPYQWGVWLTAWGREALEQAIKICGNDFLYCDTDSVYYYGDHDFTQYNAQAIADSTRNHAFAADRKGTVHYMGVMEVDKRMRAFKAMGAKKYAYIDDSGEFHITIAGVHKMKGARELFYHALRHHDTMQDALDAMEESFVFNGAGGTESVYNDSPLESLEIDGHEIYVPSNVAIKPSTYKIGLSWDYKQLLSFLLENDLFSLYRLNHQGAQLPSIEL